MWTLYLTVCIVVPTIVYVCTTLSNLKESLQEEFPGPLLPHHQWWEGVQQALDRLTLENFSPLSEAVAVGIAVPTVAVKSAWSTVSFTPEPIKEKEFFLWSDYDEIVEQAWSGEVVGSYRVPSGHPVAKRMGRSWSQDGNVLQEIFACYEHPNQQQTIPRIKHLVRPDECESDRIYEKMSERFRCLQCERVRDYA